MLMDSIVGLAVAVIVISSVAWVSQYRKIRDRIRVKKALRAQAEAVKVGIVEAALDKALASFSETQASTRP
jgi:predicted FMN-binding regulatory protein PaiB